MSFQEKSAITMTGILVLVYGAYFALVGRMLAEMPATDVPYQPLLIVAVVPLVVLATAGHIILALWRPKEAGAYDERDRLITMRAEQIGGFVLAVGVFFGIVLAMAEFAPFFIAHTLLLGWVLAEIVEGVIKVVLYHRGA